VLLHEGIENPAPDILRAVAKLFGELWGAVVVLNEPTKRVGLSAGRATARRMFQARKCGAVGVQKFRRVPLGVDPYAAALPPNIGTPIGTVTLVGNLQAK
jgi:hypothetical protein